MLRTEFLSLILLTFLSGILFADDKPEIPPAAKKEVDFVRDIKPLFKDHCIKCHGPNKQRGEFRVDNKTDALKGGESFAPAIIPGNGADSPLVKFTAGVVESMQMPPEGEKKLSKDDIGLLRAWIDQGAKWPDEPQKKDDVAGHWSFQPLKRPAVPVANSAWERNPIDPFIGAKLKAADARDPIISPNGLNPSTEADSVTLIRRVTFDLLGLPASPVQLAEFLADVRPDAYERLTDRLLASPHFGERWARHWLDVIKFAESDGFETNQPRPNAWPYRDYVVRAFNDDKPFNEFLFEQLAGDTIGIDEATGFLVAGAFDRVKSPDPALTAQQRADELHDMVSTTSSAFFGLTVGCARCHNHKFDPISHADYYSMRAVFSGVQHGERPLKPVDFEQRKQNSESLRTRLAMIDQELNQFEPLAFVAENGSSKFDPARRRDSVQRQANIERFHPTKARFIRFTVEATTGSEPCLDELEVFESVSIPGAMTRNVALSSLGTLATSSSNLPGFEIHQLAFINDGRYGNSASWISNEPERGWVMLEFVEPVEIDRIVWSRDRPENGQFQDRIPTKYRIEAGLTKETLQVVATSEDRLPFGTKSSSLPTFTGLSDAETQVARRLMTERESLRQQLQSLSTSAVIYAGRFSTPEPTFRLHRGDPMQPKEISYPGGLVSIGSTLRLGDDAADSDRRRALAEWIISSDHPLTSRVMANRIWQYHFGQGIVATSSDFGRNGVPPSHPELLDWLAHETRSNTSPKRMHRLMVTSATYRQSSAIRSDAMLVDASTRLLWRYPPRRLEAESIRDAILAVSGNLDDRMYGPGFDLFEANTNYVKVYNSKRELGPAEWRRMVYQSKPRMQLDEIFGQFDCPDAGQIAPKRTSSITALQALNLLNSRFIVKQSSQFSSRLREESGNDPAVQVRRAFQLAFLREPTDEETSAAVQLIQSHGLEAFCRATLNANEFLFVF
jgi:mono/diheme cytochrome c family protein